MKDATIFGRTTIINTIIEPKFLYATHIFDPPKKIIKKYNAIIRKYLLQNTITRIRHSTLTQNKLEGGTNLHNIEQKISSLRLKFFKKYLENSNPLTDYYLSLHIRSFKPSKNNIPRFSGRPPEFYKNLKDLINKNKEMILF